MAIAVFTYFALKVAPAGTIDSPYVQWGWRIPFFVGALIAFLVAHFIRRQVKDSLVWEQAQRSQAPLRDMFTGSSGVAFLQVFLVMTGIFFCANMLGALMPQLLLRHPGYTPTDLTLTLIVCNIPVPFAYILGGMLSDRIGRRPAIFIAGTFTAIVMSTALALLGSNSYNDWWGAHADGVLRCNRFELFDRHHACLYQRAVPNAGPVVRLGHRLQFCDDHPVAVYFLPERVDGWMPFQYTPAVLACLGGILIVLGGIVAHETLGTNLSEVDSTSGAVDITFGRRHRQPGVERERGARLRAKGAAPVFPSLTGPGASRIVEAAAMKRRAAPVDRPAVRRAAVGRAGMPRARMIAK